MPDELIQEFLVESAEGLDRLDREFVELEKQPSNPELLASIFRVIHTIKGSCGFLGFSKLQDVAHAGESLLSLMRDGKLSLSPKIADTLLAMVDAIRRLLSEIEAKGSEGDGEYSSLIQQLNELQRADSTPPVLVQPSPDVSTQACASPSAQSTDARATPTVISESNAAPDAKDTEPQPEISSKAHHESRDEAVSEARAGKGVESSKIGGLLVRRGRVRAEDIVRALSLQDHGDRRRLGEILVEMGVVTDTQVRDALRDSKDAAPTEGTIRVDVTLLDKLMNMVGELVLARNQVLQFTSAHADAAFLGASQRLNLITTELQEGVMKTRMLPIGQVWTKFPRVVRDLSVSCNRKVRLEMEGKETELDKTLIEAIKDPLTHLVRNSVDHGIEPPDVRTQHGKPEEGRVLLRAYHEGGQVNIEISDDGAGIDPERIKRKTLEKGLISAERAARMTDREAVNLIFLAGLSTAEKVTSVSGRGVGMDVVKTNIEKIGGTVDIQSVLGAGTTIKIKIPLTLAIISALVVSCCGDCYAIPQISVLELVRVEPEKIASAIEDIHGAPVYRLRGNLLPLVFLGRELEIETREPASDDGAATLGSRAGKAFNIVVLQADDQQFGLVVDEINNTEEIVVKPIGQQLKGISAYAGATIMGDGRVALILDVLGLAQHSRVVKEAHERARAGTISRAQSEVAKTEALLLFQDTSGSRMAIPLSHVERLEEFPAASLETVDAYQVVQYRGQIMPIVKVLDVIPERRKQPRVESAEGTEAANTAHVVVFHREGKSLGLMVHRIVDVVEEALSELGPPARPGILGTVVIQGKVTELLDVPLISAKVLGEFHAEGVAVTVERGR